MCVGSDQRGTHLRSGYRPVKRPARGLPATVRAYRSGSPPRACLIAAVAGSMAEGPGRFAATHPAGQVARLQPEDEALEEWR